VRQSAAAGVPALAWAINKIVGGSTRKMAGRIFGLDIDASIAARCCACLTVESQ
jgi:hypothetical protein